MNAKGMFFAAAALILFSCRTGLAYIQFTDPDPDPAAHIITTPTVQAGSVTLDIDGDGVNDFTFSTGYNMHFITYAMVDAVVSGLNGAKVAYWRPLGDYADAQNLSSGSPVDDSLSYGNGSRVFETHFDLEPYYFGSGYMGFTLSRPDGLHYGWMQIDTNVPNPSCADIYVRSWAYETAPDTAILAGAVPEPATLALLALAGAAALRRRRR